MLEPEMEAFLLRLVPGLAGEWQGSSDEEIEEIEEIAGQELPPFYRWFLSKMGRNAGALNRYLRPYLASVVSSAYARGEVDSRPPLLLIARMDDPVMPLDLHYDLSQRIRDDAHVVRSVGGEDTAAAETLREWLGWIVLIAMRVNPSPQRCEGTLKEHGGDAKGQLTAVLDELGFTSPIATGPYCGVYERADAAMACKVDPDPSNTDLLCFDLGGPDAGTLRRILGEIATKSGIEVSITRWAPPLPK